MKRIIKCMVLFISVILIQSVCALDLVETECTSSEIVDLYSIANHVTFDFEYDEETGKFNILIENLNPYISAVLGNDIYRYSSKGTKMYGFKEGQRINLYISASEYSPCNGQVIRTMSYVTPYINKYLDTEDCYKHSEAEICNTKFINYDLTYSLFKKMIEESVKKEKESVTPIEEKESHWYDIYLEYLDKYGMQAGLFLLGAVSTIIIGQGAIARAKAKF